MSATKTMYRLEVRPLIATPFKTVTIWNSKTGKYDKYKLKRGQWFTAHRRLVDGKAVFAGSVGTTRLNNKIWVDTTASQYKKLGFATRIVPVEILKYPHLRGDLDADNDVLVALNNVARDLGENINVVSGGRTRAEQQFLYDLYLAGKGNLAAKPGTSRHETGRAVDAYIRGVALGAFKGGKRTADKHGMSFPVPGEDWHAELSK